MTTATETEKTAKKDVWEEKPTDTPRGKDGAGAATVPHRFSPDGLLLPSHPPVKDATEAKPSLLTHDKNGRVIPPPKPSVEKAVDFLNWFGIGWVINTGLSVANADWLNHGWIQPKFNDWWERGANTWIFRRRKEAFTPEEISGLDAFVAHVKEHPNFANAGGGKLAHLLDHAENAAKQSEGLLQSLEGHLSHGTGSALERFAATKEAAMALDASRTKSRFWLTFLMLNSGGIMVLPVMKMIDNCKTSIMRGLHPYFGGKGETEEEKRAFEARCEYIEKHEPPQSWSSVLSARAISTPAILSVYFATGQEDNWLKKLGAPFKGADYHLEQASNWFTDKLESSSAIKRAMTPFQEKLGVTVEGWEKAFDEKGIRYHKPQMSGLTAGEARSRKIMQYLGTDLVYALVMAAFVYTASRFTALFFNARHPDREKEEIFAKSYGSAMQPDVVGLAKDFERDIAGHNGRAHPTFALNGHSFDLPEEAERSTSKVSEAAHEGRAEEKTRAASHAAPA